MGPRQVFHDVLFQAFLLLLGCLQPLIGSLKELFLLGHLGSQVQEFFLHQRLAYQSRTVRAWQGCSPEHGEEGC